MHWGILKAMWVGLVILEEVRVAAAFTEDEVKDLRANWAKAFIFVVVAFGDDVGVSCELAAMIFFLFRRLWVSLLR